MSKQRTNDGDGCLGCLILIIFLVFLGGAVQAYHGAAYILGPPLAIVMLAIIVFGLIFLFVVSRKRHTDDTKKVLRILLCILAADFCLLIIISFFRIIPTLIVGIALFGDLISILSIILYVRAKAKESEEIKKANENSDSNDEIQNERYVQNNAVEEAGKGESGQEIEKTDTAEIGWSPVCIEDIDIDKTLDNALHTDKD